MLELMRAADIPIPEYVPPRRSTSSAGYFAAMDSILFWGKYDIYICDIYIYNKLYINCTCPKLAKCFDEPYCLFRPSWRGSSRNALPDPAPPSDDGMGNMEDERC